MRVPFGHIALYRSTKIGDEMDSPEEHFRIMAAIEHGVDVARKNLEPGKTTPGADFVAWCVWNELRRAGFKVVSREK